MIVTVDTGCVPAVDTVEVTSWMLSKDEQNSLALRAIRISSQAPTWSLRLNCGKAPAAVDPIKEARAERKTNRTQIVAIVAWE